MFSTFQICFTQFSVFTFSFHMFSCMHVLFVTILILGYDVSRQPKKNADSSKKGLFHYLPKEKDDHQSSLKSKSSPTSETYQPQDSGTSDNFTYFRGDCLSTDSVEQINVCLSSDKAGILTRIKHWFSRQNDKTENPYEYSGKASKSPTH